MKQKNKKLLLKWLMLSIFVISITACQKDCELEPDDTTNDTTAINDTIPTDTIPTDTIPTDTIPTDTIPDMTEACNDSLLPVVVMHGFLASGDTYATQFQRMTSNDYCAERIFAFDWNSVGFGVDNTAALDAFVDEVLAQTNAAKINLVGHSAGGDLGYSYLSDATRAEKVAHYVHLGSNYYDNAAGDGQIPTLNIWSSDDETVPGSDIPNATNLMLTGADHYEVATNAETFAEMYRFFNNGQEPETTEIETESEIIVSGKALSLGLNEALANAEVSIYAVSSATGERLSATPDAVFTTDDGGFWGPFEVQANTNYEFLVAGSDANDRVIHYYREAFTHSNKLVYLRTLPPPFSLAGFLTNSLPSDDNQSVMAVFAASQAVINNRDELYVDGNELSTDEFASSEQTTIAFFLYDDGDYNTSLSSVGLFGSFPFLNGIDMFFDTAEPTTISIEMNGRTLNVPNWKSETEGITVVVFD